MYHRSLGSHNEGTGGKSLWVSSFAPDGSAPSSTSSRRPADRFGACSRATAVMSGRCELPVKPQPWTDSAWRRRWHTVGIDTRRPMFRSGVVLGWRNVICLWLFGLFHKRLRSFAGVRWCTCGRVFVRRPRVALGWRARRQTQRVGNLQTHVLRQNEQISFVDRLAQALHADLASRKAAFGDTLLQRAAARTAPRLPARGLSAD